MKIIYVLAFLIFASGFILFSYQSGVGSVTPQPTPIIRATPSPTPIPTPEISFEDQVWERINNWKQKEDGYKYIKDNVLCKFAEIRTEQIKTDWSHDGFYKINNQLNQATSFNSYGENLSKDIIYPVEISVSWLNSPKHRENLNKKYTHSCIKCEDYYCVQLFASFDYL